MPVSRSASGQNASISTSRWRARPAFIASIRSTWRARGFSAPRSTVPSSVAIEKPPKQRITSVGFGLRLGRRVVARHREAGLLGGRAGERAVLGARRGRRARRAPGSAAPSAPRVTDVRAADSAASASCSAFREPIRASASALPARAQASSAAAPSAWNSATARSKASPTRSPARSAPQPSRNEARAAPHASSSRDAAAAAEAASARPSGLSESASAARPMRASADNPIRSASSAARSASTAPLTSSPQSSSATALPTCAAAASDGLDSGSCSAPAEEVDRVRELAGDERGEPAREAPAGPGEARRLAADGGGIADRRAAQDAEPVRGRHEGRLDPGRDREALAAADLGRGGAAEAALGLLVAGDRACETAGRPVLARTRELEPGIVADERVGKQVDPAGAALGELLAAAEQARDRLAVLGAGVRAQRVRERAVVLEQPAGLAVVLARLLRVARSRRTSPRAGSAAPRGSGSGPGRRARR